MEAIEQEQKELNEETEENKINLLEPRKIVLAFCRMHECQVWYHDGWESWFCGACAQEKDKKGFISDELVVITDPKVKASDVKNDKKWLLLGGIKQAIYGERLPHEKQHISYVSLEGFSKN